MKVKVFTKVMEVRKGIFSFIQPQEAEVIGELDQQAAAQLAQHFGAPIKRSFQDTGDDTGLIIIGLRYKPVAIVVPEGHPKFDNRIIITYKLPKAA